MRIADHPIRESANRRAWNDFKNANGHPLISIPSIIAAALVGLSVELITPDHWWGGDAGFVLGAISGLGTFVVILIVVYITLLLRALIRQRNEARSSVIDSKSRGLSIEIEDVEQVPVNDDGSQIWRVGLLVINRQIDPEGIVRAWLEIEEPEGHRILTPRQIGIEPIELPIRLEGKESRRIRLTFTMGPRTGEEKSLTLVAVDHSARRLEVTISKNGIPEHIDWIGSFYLPTDD